MSIYSIRIAIPRSVAIANWMKDLIDKVIKEPLLKIYEVGAGQGSLLAQLKKMFPDTEFSGCEMSENAVIKAKETGLSIVQGDYFAIDGKYDLIISFGVLEHVESPYDFLSYLRNHLNDHGYLLIGQPMQDVASYDIFFVDHLHHFHTSHIELLAKRAGFDQVGISSSPWFASNFSLHLLQKSSSKTNLGNIVYIPTKAYDSLTFWNNVFREIDLISQNDSNARDNYAIYGLGEIATLLYCYGGLNKLNISIGIDDNPERYKQNIFDIPIKKIEDLSVEDKDKVIAVLLTCNFMYYSYLIGKCTKSGLSTIKILK